VQIPVEKTFEAFVVGLHLRSGEIIYAQFRYHADLLGTKAVEMSPDDQKFKGTWTNGLHGFRVRT
jgi:hypothetical protein